ncbi:hypothetical protein THAOC_17704, partial [Thalassiosira oceanica]
AMEEDEETSTLQPAPSVDRVETGAKASQGLSHYGSKKERFTEGGDSQSETSYEFIYEQFDGAPTIDRVEMVEKASLEMYRPIWTVLNGCIGPGEPLWSILLRFLRP